MDEVALDDVGRERAKRLHCVCWLNAAEFARRWAARIREVASSESDDFRALADTRAKACEDMAAAMAAQGEVDKTPPLGTWIPPEAKP